MADDDSIVRFSSATNATFSSSVSRDSTHHREQRASLRPRPVLHKRARSARRACSGPSVPQGYRKCDEDRYPFSPRIRTLTGILAKLEPPKPAGGTYTAAAALRTATHHGKAAAGAALRFTVRADRSG